MVRRILLTYSDEEYNIFKCLKDRGTFKSWEEFFLSLVKIEEINK
jgi:hypothetical protein